MVQSGRSNTQEAERRPISKTLLVADGTFLWMERSAVNMRTGQVNHTLKKEPVADRYLYKFPGPVAPTAMKLALDLFHMRPDGSAERDGREAYVFRGTRIRGEKWPRELTESGFGEPAFATAKVLVDVQTGIILSFAVYGDEASGNRLTLSFEVFDLKRNASLRKEDFTYTEGQTTLKALEQAIAAQERTSE